MDDLTRRAFTAYFRSGATEQPGGHSGVVEHAGLRYVVLANVNGILAVYRVFRKNNADALRRLVRWPAELA